MVVGDLHHMGAEGIGEGPLLARLHQPVATGDQARRGLAETGGEPAGALTAERQAGVDTLGGGGGRELDSPPRPAQGDSRLGTERAPH